MRISCYEGSIIFLAYNKYVMNSETKRSKDLIKIRFKNQDKVKNKVMSSKNLSYAQFSSKISSSFEIDNQKYYKLYYLDEDKEVIIVNTEEDYQIFLEIELLILYLEPTEDKSFDFRVFVKKDEGVSSKDEPNQELMKRLQEKEGELSSWKAKYLEQSTKFQDQRALCQTKLKNQQIQLNQATKQIKVLNIVVKKREEELAKLKQLQRSVNSSTREEYHKLIEDKKKSMLTQLQKFRKDLQQKTKNEMKAKLIEIQKQLQPKKQESRCHFQHKISCQSAAKCPHKKQITGFRYRCIACSIDVCQDCSNQQFKTKTAAHLPNHPMVRFSDDRWDDQIVTQLKKRSPSKQQAQQKPKQSENRQKISTIASFMSISEQQAIKLMQKFPNLSAQQIIQKHLG